jgi:2-dehydro-3-deoxyphosphogluconate aldolase/(4S)-4-hydroxy-2-oxoglutarate aldolase
MDDTRFGSAASEPTITKEDFVKRIIACGVLPVVRAPSSEIASRAVECMVAGGIDVVEITMTVPGACNLIETLSVRYGERVLVGAGTVLDAATARRCLGAGARFIVSPATDEETIALCRSQGAPVLPGAMTPTEIVRAARAGADLIKVFPCGALGGARYIKALRGPLPNLRFVPTGGISEDTIGDYIRAGASAVGMGSELVDVVKLGQDAASLTAAARRCVEAVRSARIRSVGVGL